MQDLEQKIAAEEIKRIVNDVGIKVFWEEKRSTGSAPSARASANLNFLGENYCYLFGGDNWQEYNDI